MPFTLTKDDVHSILDPLNLHADFAPFLGALDPEFRWVSGSEKKDSTRLTGVYNFASWMDEVAKPCTLRLKDGKPKKITVSSIDIFGNKAIVESRNVGTQLNGNPYNQSYVWILIFSEDTGKIIELREYWDTALAQELIQTNPL
ncbi:hypothetical protein B0H19DRAFT_1244592 [Mycena capillaripes]|nr:hypothetical protein B0H19DRAFT_1244592 [Mycena capillaripes]